MHSIPLFLAVLIAFILSFMKHISFVMYPLSAVIFYYYLPVLYATSRINILDHIKNTEVFHIKFYPMELGMWFVSTLFFGFILSHLISDLLFHYRKILYHFLFFLFILGILGVILCEHHVFKNKKTSKKTIFEIQGRILSFEILFFMTWLFVINH